MQLTPLTSVSLVVSRNGSASISTLSVTPIPRASPRRDVQPRRSAEWNSRGRLPAIQRPSLAARLQRSGRHVNVGATILGRHRLDTSFGATFATRTKTSRPYYLSTGGTVTLTTQVSGAVRRARDRDTPVLDYSQSTSVSHTTPTRRMVAAWVPHPPNAPRRDQRRVVAPQFRPSPTGPLPNNRIFGTFTWGTAP